jgi:hypothetical protein
MYLLYVDESGDTGIKGSDHLILTGAALFEGKWRWIHSDLAKLLARFFPIEAERPRELHASEARKSRGEYSRLTQAQREELLRDACGLLTALRSHEVCLFTIVVDKAWWFARNPDSSGGDLYVEMFEDLVSRFDLFLKRQHHEGRTSKGLVVADPRHGAFCRALRRAVERFRSEGTRWADLENVIETVLFLESHESPGVQLADLASYAVWRLVETADPTLATELKYCFDRESVTSSSNPGKWHGVKYRGPHDGPGRSRVDGIWPAT